MSAEESTQAYVAVKVIHEYGTMVGLPEINEQITIFLDAENNPYEGSIAASEPGKIYVTVSSPSYSSASESARMKVIIHEFVHAVYQHGQSGLSLSAQFGDVPDAGPRWLAEGVAEFLAYEALSNWGTLSYQVQRSEPSGFVDRANSADQPLREMESLAGFISVRNANAYSLLAAEFLAAHAGYAALIDFYVLAQPGTTWTEAFELAFGMTIERFYELFETHRARGFPDPAAVLAPAYSDVLALRTLYNATNGDSWDFNYNWLSDKPLREWFGVLTDVSGRVIELRLFSNDLIGELPPELAGLSKLRAFRLGSNRLSGEIPKEISELSNLRILSLNNNLLGGMIPPELSELTSLMELELYHNRLSGPIPPELGGLTNLRYLTLFGNRLTGEIPPELGNLWYLETLLLSSNNLIGEIPPELGGLANLKQMVLWFNKLSGGIPAALGDLLNLEDLSLEFSGIAGGIPPELGHLSNLKTLGLSGNRLTGEIPVELGRLTNLVKLRLSGNTGLTGCLPVHWATIEENDFDELGLAFCESGSLTP